MILLDTDALSIVQRAEGPAYDLLVERLDSADEQVVVSIVSFEEQMRGWLAFIARAKTSSEQVNAYAKLHALLITRNLIDFRTVPGLRIADWTQ